MSTTESPETMAPWKQRFFAPFVGVPRVAAANPERGIVLSDREDSVIQVYAWDVPTGALRRLTDHSSGVFEGWIAADGRHVYYLQDEQGNELGHLVRVPFEGGAIEDVTLDLTPYTLRGVGMSASGNMVALNPVNGDGFQVYCVPLDADAALGTPRQVYQNKFESWFSELSHDGSIVALISSERAGGQRRYSTVALDTSDGSVIGELWDGLEASVEVIRFSPVAGDSRLVATTSRSGFIRPVIWNPRTDERIDLDLPDLTGEVAPVDWSADGTRLLLCQTDRAAQQLYSYDLASATLTRLNHPQGTFYIPAPGERGPFFAANGEIFASLEDSTHPVHLVALDDQTGEQKRVLIKVEEVPPGSPWRSVVFQSSDGADVQGWLAVPDGDGPFPTVIDMHGGPHYVQVNGFYPMGQTWLDHGFAFLSVNFRGSTTFGRDFKEKIWGDIGHWEIEDVVAGRAWLVDQGIARPDAIFLHGGSYGGFLTLLGLGKRPDLWAGGVALVAIGDLVVNYEDCSDALKAADRAWFGGTPDEKPELYRVASPITYAEQVVAPMLVLQGRNDTRTTARQMELYEERLRSLGKQIEVHWFDTGHGPLPPDQFVAFYERAMQFATDIVDALPNNEA